MRDHVVLAQARGAAAIERRAVEAAVLELRVELRHGIEKLLSRPSTSTNQRRMNFFKSCDLG